ncbi:MAG: VWA-like domain-containing protein [bacterium]
MNKYEISDEIFTLVKNNILLKLRFLEVIIFRLEILPGIIPLGTDGINIYYDPDYIIETFKKDKLKFSSAYLHTCFHALLRNPLATSGKDRIYWDVACDICVENIIDDLNNDSLTRDGKLQRKKVIDEIKDVIKFIQPDIVYLFLKQNTMDIEYLYNLFVVDNHEGWYGQIVSCDSPGDSNQLNSSDNGDTGNSNQSGGATSTSDSEGGDSDGSGNSSDSTDLNSSNSSQGAGNSESSSQGDTSDDSSRGSSQMTPEQAEEMWTNIANRLLIEIKCFSKQIGCTAGALFDQLGAVTKEKYDYESFLKKFASLQEAPRINDDEYDMIFYTYGLKTYGNLPLIEPLEYKEVYLVRDFVIAIDTSGSVQGEVVKAFLNKTYNILESTNSFGHSFNLYIIQCDTEIQEAVKITNKKEFDTYINNCIIKGFGGTDFRPVFEYVEDLVRRKEFTRLKGLIYFTDGYGTFPTKKTKYKTCFAFIDQIDYNNVDVPIWATKIILEKEDI